LQESGASIKIGPFRGLREVMRKVLYILGELEDSDLQWLYDAGKPQWASAGAPIIGEGTPVDCLYIVVDGELGVSKAGRELARLGAGEVVGDMSLLDSRPSSATVTPIQDSLVFAIPQSRLRAKLGADAGFASRFYRSLCIFLANRLARTDAMVGAGGRVPLEESGLHEDDEISPEALGNLALAGARFDWFLQRIRKA
jgi:CRP-like cAMP-binding protein